MGNLMLIQARYKAQTGTYISVVPDYISYLMSFLEADFNGGRKSVPADLHCTVMYAPNSILTPEQQQLILETAGRFRAYSKQLTCWQGEDGESYVVLELDCPELVEFNSWLRSHFGMVPTFDEYNPHITLVSGLPAMATKSVPLPRIKLNLSGMRIEDAK